MTPRKAAVAPIDIFTKKKTSNKWDCIKSLSPVSCVLRHQPLCLLLACYSTPTKSSRIRLPALPPARSDVSPRVFAFLPASQKLLAPPSGAMADEKESTSTLLSQVAEAVDPEDPPKSPQRPSSPTTSTRKVRI
jgi:hypothetical protein